MENRVLANPATVMRIASISKAVTAAALGRLWQEDKIDLDRPVHQYVEEWPAPPKQPEITARQLLSHLAGVRHYKTKQELEDKSKEDPAFQGDGRFKEFLLNKKYGSVREALEIFKDDELLSQPGEKWNIHRVLLIRGWGFLGNYYARARKATKVAKMRFSLRDALNCATLLPTKNLHSYLLFFSTPK